MDRWKSKSEMRREEMEKVRSEKMQVREKVEKSRNTVFFQCFVAPGYRKVGSLKRRVRRHLGRWDMKSCKPLWREADLEVKCTKHLIVGALLEVEMLKKYTPLWREAHLEVIMYKTRHVRTTFGTWDVQKVHAVVAQSKFESENVQNTTCSYHFLTMQWPSDVQKVHAVVARSTFGSQKC